MKIYIKRTTIESVWVCDKPFMLTDNNNYVFPDYGSSSTPYNHIIIKDDSLYYDIITHFNLEINNPIELEI